MITHSGTALAWLCLSNHYQLVAVIDEVCHSVHKGVPQGSVLGPLPLTQYMLPLGRD